MGALNLYHAVCKPVSYIESKYQSKKNQTAYFLRIFRYVATLYHDIFHLHYYMPYFTIGAYRIRILGRAVSS